MILDRDSKGRWISPSKAPKVRELTDKEKQLQEDFLKRKKQ